MLKEEEYEVLKTNFAESQRLFNKLLQVSLRAVDIDYDESGFYQDEEETCERHWLTLSGKVVDSLSKALKEFDIELLKNDSLEDTQLVLNIKSKDESSKIRVEYSQNDSISITQIS